MSNKSLSRKKKYRYHLGNLLRNYINVIVNIKLAIQKERENNYPKLAKGGICYGSSNELIKGGEMIVPIIPKIVTPYENTYKHK